MNTDLIDLEVTDGQSSWNLPLSRERWAEFVAAAIRHRMAEPEAIDQALAAFAARPEVTGIPLLDRLSRQKVTWRHVLAGAGLLLACYAMTSFLPPPF